MAKDVIASAEFELHGESYEARKYHPEHKPQNTYCDIVRKGTETVLKGKMRPIARDFLRNHGIETGDKEHTYEMVAKIIKMKKEEA